MQAANFSKLLLARQVWLWMPSTAHAQAQLRCRQQLWSRRSTHCMPTLIKSAATLRLFKHSLPACHSA